MSFCNQELENKITEIKRNTQHLMDTMMEEDNYTQKYRHAHCGEYKGYVCPICGSGRGNTGTGITTKDGIHYRCWSQGCLDFGQANGKDVIDIYRMQHQGVSFGKAVSDLWEMLGNPVATSVSSRSSYSAPIKKEPEENRSKEQKDHLLFYMKSNENLARGGGADYLAQRGISLSLAMAVKLGYQEHYNHRDEITPALIIPTSRHSFSARRIGNHITSGKYIKHGKRALYLKQFIKYATKGLVVTEGEIEALSIMELGGYAVAIGGANNTDLFLEEIKEHPVDLPILIHFDADEAGRNATAKLTEKLREVNLFCVDLQGKLTEQGMDINDNLIRDRKNLKSRFDFLEKDCYSKYLEGKELSCIIPIC